MYLLPPLPSPHQLSSSPHLSYTSHPSFSPSPPLLPSLTLQIDWKGVAEMAGALGWHILHGIHRREDDKVCKERGEEGGGRGWEEKIVVC